MNHMQFPGFPTVLLLGRFGTSSDDIGNFIAKFFANFLEGDVGVFNGVVQESGGNHSFRTVHLQEDKSDADWMSYIRQIANFPALLLVGASSEPYSPVDQ